MALAIVDAQTAGTSATTTSVTLALGSSSNAFFAWLGCGNNSVDVCNSATLDGAAVTLNGPITLNGNRWYWIGENTALTGSKVLTANWSAGSFHRLIGVAFSDAHGTAPFGTPVTVGATGSTIDFGTFSGTTGDIVIGLVQENTGRTMTPGTGGSYISPFTGASTFAHGFQEPGGASVPFDCTLSGSSTHFACAVNVISGAPAISNSPRAHYSRMLQSA